MNKREKMKWRKACDEVEARYRAARWVKIKSGAWRLANVDGYSIISGPDCSFCNIGFTERGCLSCIINIFNIPRAVGLTPGNDSLDPCCDIIFKAEDQHSRQIIYRALKLIRGELEK